LDGTHDLPEHDPFLMQKIQLPPRTQQK